MFNFGVAGLVAKIFPDLEWRFFWETTALLIFDNAKESSIIVWLFFEDLPRLRLPGALFGLKIEFSIFADFSKSSPFANPTCVSTLDSRARLIFSFCERRPS